jgi:hypothetical protein
LEEEVMTIDPHVSAPREIELWDYDCFDYSDDVYANEPEFLLVIEEYRLCVLARTELGDWPVGYLSLEFIDLARNGCRGTVARNSKNVVMIRFTQND